MKNQYFFTNKEILQATKRFKEHIFTGAVLATKKAMFKVQLDRNKKVHLMQHNHLKKILLIMLYLQIRKLCLRFSLVIIKMWF